MISDGLADDAQAWFRWFRVGDFQTVSVAQHRNEKIQHVHHQPFGLRGVVRVHGFDAASQSNLLDEMMSAIVSYSLTNIHCILPETSSPKNV